MFEKSAALVPKLIHYAQIDSTSLELARLDRSELPEFTAVCASQQTRGQGRLGREWISEPNTSVAVSLLLRPTASLQQISWLTLMAGCAVRAAVTELTQIRATLKWPNDVLVNGKKVSGILARFEGSDLILGVGINIAPQKGAPDTAISLLELGAELEYDEVLGEFLVQFRARYNKFLIDPGWGIEATANEFREHSSTLGQNVRAIYPDGSELVGKAVDIDSAGNLQIQSDKLHSVSAADIVHLRN